MKRRRRAGRNPDEPPLPQWEVEWSRRLFMSLRERGIWGVPRSGLMFQRQDDTLVLVEIMPWTSGMPLSARELRRYQDEDYDAIARRFRAAGFRVRKGERA